MGIVVCAALLGLVGAPAAFGAVWESRELPVDESVVHASLHGVSCPSESLCIAVGESGAVASSTNPTGGAGEWRLVRPNDPTLETDECRAVTDADGEWEATCPSGRHLYRGLRAVSCPTASLCVAVTYDGYVYSSIDPTGPATSWRLADIDGTEQHTHLESVSCPDPGFCVAVSGNQQTAGKVLTTTDPTGSGSAWQVTQLDPSLDLRGISCTSRSFCLAVAHNGIVLKSSNPGGGVAAWERVGTPGGSGDLEGVACVDTTSFLCLAGNAGGNLLSSVVPGVPLSSWGEANGGASVQITGISCASPSRCAAVDNNGDVLVSTDPGAAGSWSIENLVPFTPPTPREPPLNALFGVSCASDGLCALVGAKGRIFTSTNPFAAATSSPSAPGERKRRRLVKRPRTILVKADRFREVTHRKRLKVRFRFYARSKVRGFVCKRDRGRYRRCRSPLRYWVPLGEHALRVRAIGPTGLRGPVAMIRFNAIENPYVR